HLHEVVLRVDEWVGPLEDGWGNGDASAAAVATLAAIVAGIGYRATEAFQCWHQNHQAGKQVAYCPWDRMPSLRDAAHTRLLHHLGLIVRSKMERSAGRTRKRRSRRQVPNRRVVR